MDIGKKLRQARLDAGMSQRQLCADVITRNMLSLIENGSARPSMDTLAYLAQRLGKPMAFFLEETQPSDLQMAKDAYVRGDYPGALELLTHACPDPSQEDEFAILELLVLLAMAEQSLDRPIYARELLEQGARLKSCYITPELEQRRLILLGQVSEEPVVLPPDDRPLLHRAKMALDAGNATKCAAILEACEDQQGRRWRHLRAEAAFALEDYALAVQYYEEDDLARLEECYRNLGDFKMAYEYACKQRKPSSNSGKTVV